MCVEHSQSKIKKNVSHTVLSLIFQYFFLFLSLFLCLSSLVDFLGVCIAFQNGTCVRMRILFYSISLCGVVCFQKRSQQQPSNESNENIQQQNHEQPDEDDVKENETKRDFNVFTCCSRQICMHCKLSPNLNRLNRRENREWTNRERESDFITNKNVHRTVWIIICVHCAICKR